MTERLQKYPKYKDSRLEWLGEIPDHWEQKRIKETACLINGYPFDSKMFEAGKGMPLVRIRDIRASKTEVGFMGEIPPESLIDNGDVLVGMDGDFNVSLWAGGEAALNQRVACVRAENYHLQKFIFYVLPFNMKVINDLTYFTTVKHLSSIDILKTLYALPPVGELDKIVVFLDHETAKIDSLIEKQQQLIKLLKEKRQAVISHAVTKGLNPNAPMRDSGVEWLGEVPEHWIVTKLGQLAFMQEGPGLRTWQFKDQGTRVICVTNITAEGINFSKLEKYISNEEYMGSYRHFTVNNGDILLSSSGNSWGKVARYEGDEKVILNTSTIRLNELQHRPLLLDFIQNFLHSEACREQLGIAMTGSCQPNFGPTHLKEIKTPIPPKNEQLAISEYIDKEVHKYDQPLQKCQQAIQLMNERRAALISAAVTGKIDVRKWQPPEPSNNKMNKEVAT